jgi:acyl dehydratase
MSQTSRHSGPHRAKRSGIHFDVKAPLENGFWRSPEWRHKQDAYAMETVGLGIHFEDLPVGRKFKTVGRTITEVDIVNFVNCVGLLEVMFTNSEFLKGESAVKGGRYAPAMLAFGICEGLLVQATMQHTALAFLGMQFDVHAPVLAGDTIHVEVEVIEARVSKSRPDRGLVRTRNEIVKQDGTKVITYTPLRMVKTRKAAE